MGGPEGIGAVSGGSPPPLPERLRVDLGPAAGHRRLAVFARGPRDDPRPVLCVHGLTRNARDFDALALALAARGRRVLQLDVAGRGASDPLPDPAAYDLPTYAGDVELLLDRLGVARVDWVGTSMGGLVALELARRAPGRIGRLVLNDIGPWVPKEALAPIADYLGLDPVFPTLDALEAHLRAVHAGFGPLTDLQWRHLALHSARRDDGGRFRLHYDPRIREPFLARALSDVDLWDGFARLAGPVLVLRGAESPILPEAVVAEMVRRRPGTEVRTFAGVGHAPALMDPAQIAPVVAFLSADPAQ